MGGPTSAALLPASLGPLQGCATGKGGLAGHQAHGRHFQGGQQAGKPSTALWADDKCKILQFPFPGIEKESLHPPMKLTWV